MIIHLGNDMIESLANGKYRATKQSAWSMGEFDSFSQAKFALSLTTAEIAHVREMYAMWQGGETMQGLMECVLRTRTVITPSINDGSEWVGATLVDSMDGSKFLTI